GAGDEYILPLYLGKDAAGTPVVRDLDDMPHLLIAGTTGSGKSVCIGSIILSLLMKRPPDELKLLLIDPKMVELSAFKDIPHLISPVVTDMKRAPLILQWLVRTMDERYELFLRVGVKKISSYNQLSEKKIRERLSEDGEEPLNVPLKLPYVIVVIDELADLMMAASDDVETAITRISQKSRAVGIHLVLATQRPSVDVITGLIKSNMPARISFKVSAKVDSRTILDRNGAERLLGKGDMLFLQPSTTDLIRSQCTFVSEKEIHNIVDFLKAQGSPVYDPELLELETRHDFETLEDDELFDEAARIILETKRGSVSLIQRRLNIGYSRAARLVEMMAKVGIVGAYKNSKAREVMMTLEEWENLRVTQRG
ncbi:MAG: FtsK/SpoIIIE domain-containing protein, partial [Planctomycetota bacterium]|nr:FtsK/SpoIIIE domain-containing protein [Planctomycetota bacterium]MDI6787183.1 FtsK/SpoIIIE domain-containing protein [Planctomycetota bacterium]